MALTDSRGLKDQSGHRALQAQLVQRVLPAPRVRKGRKECQGWTAKTGQKVRQGHKDQPERQALRGPQAPLVLLVRRETWGRLVRTATML